MVKRPVLLVALLLYATCTPRADERREAGLTLRGFALADPTTRRIRRADLFLERGRVVQAPSPGLAHRTVPGHGRFLLPALWDLKASD